MRYVTEKEYQQKLKKIRAENATKKRLYSLEQERNKYKRKIKLPSTSKLMAVYLFVILNVVLIYAMVSMWHFMDLSYLGVLITDVAAQVITYLVYSVKSLKENTSTDGFVYEARMRDLDAKYAQNDANSVG